uniref:Putative secreted protein n=1 Tax=Anopheles darlingi TaxID=43151 RepID=A0A2M4D6T0_ANODA
MVIVLELVLLATTLGSDIAVVAESDDAMTGADVFETVTPVAAIGEDVSFFFLRGGRPDSASLSLESLELESLELEDEESLELLLEDIFPPEGATSCLLASSFFAFFLAVPS